MFSRGSTDFVTPDFLKRRKFWIVALLILFAAGARVAVAHYLANDQPDDGRVYAQIARNVLEQHVYSHETQAPYVPSLIRVPGYPLFLAAIYKVFGHTNNGAVRIAQALMDTATCVLIGLLAWYWQPDEKRKPATAIAAFVIAAACPFTMIYSATILTEVPTMFFAVAMCVAATIAFRKTFTTEDTEKKINDQSKNHDSKYSVLWWIVAGLLGGIAVMIRPDSGFFALAVGLTVAIIGSLRFRERWRQTLIAGSLFSLAFMLVLGPWTIRNARVFHLFQPIAPMHAEMPGEFIPFGYTLWLKTWLDDDRYVGPMWWQLDTDPIDIDDLPPSAFDSPDERDRVGALLDKYNHAPDSDTANANSADQNSDEKDDKATDENDQNDKGDQSDDADKTDSGDQNGKDDNSDQADAKTSVEMTPEIDAAFAQIARERIARHPFRYYIWLRMKRAATMWFDTHSQYWPFEGYLVPLDDLDHSTHQQYWLPLFAGLNWLYTLLALAGGWALWRSMPFRRHGLLPGAKLSVGRRWLLLAALLVLPRLAFISTMENPEPRYIVEFFPFLCVLSGIAFAGLPALISRRRTTAGAWIVRSR
jgi:hypothetical protein